MSNRNLDYEDYTVGWICPLEVEQIAALEMLDEEHECLPQSPADHNAYILGSIGRYNVVIVGLYVPGNCAAATVITQMRTTFPELRFGLLVGIGGGVPTTTDNGMIRLGDIVVSKPSGKHSGAVQYDHGKAEAGQFKQTGSLAPPPAVLLNAAQILTAKRARARKDPILENIKRINTDILGLRRYKHPGPEQDHLYQPDYTHLDPKVSCSQCKCDPTRRVQRDINNDENDIHVVVHRGTIASGELVIKNGVLRDQLAEEYGVLCFEMEAAGALADFPCLIIRGISDYCDSHKNNQWHGYAAATAAAYARELFFNMPIDKVKCYAPLGLKNGVNHLVKRQDNRATSTRGSKVTEPSLGPLFYVYRGKLNWPNINEGFAFGESFIVILPTTLDPGQLVCAYWQWTEDTQGATKRNMDIVRAIDNSESTASGTAFWFSNKTHYRLDATLALDKEELLTTLSDRSGNKSESTTLLLKHSVSGLSQDTKWLVYVGKLNWYHYAVDEILIIVVPSTFSYKDPICAYWQWSVDATGAQKSCADVQGVINIATLKGFKKRIGFFYDEYYKFDGEVARDQESITLTMSNPAGEKSKPITLYRSIKA